MKQIEGREVSGIREHNAVPYYSHCLAMCRQDTGKRSFYERS